MAKAVQRGDLRKIEQQLGTNPKLLDITNETTGSNILSLSLTLENFEAFKKLLELGADPNFVNRYSKRSLLIDACKFYWKPKPYTVDLRFIELLLHYGADPNYAVEIDHTDEKGRSYFATSPLMEASKLDLEMVKLLIKAGANPYKELKQNHQTPFVSSIQGFEDRFRIASYFIDSLNVDFKKPMLIRKNDTLYIQDYVVNQFLKAKLMGDTTEIRKLSEEYPKMEDANRKGWDFIQKLESLGVDFMNHEYKK